MKWLSNDLECQLVFIERIPNIGDALWYICIEAVNEKKGGLTSLKRRSK